MGSIITRKDLKINMNELEPIIRYKMDEMEAKAFKIGLMWQDECRSNLPGEKYEKFRKGCDPRKTSLFRHCYKLAKETKGLIPDNEIKLYVRAQIQVLKSIREGKVHALISPHCLVGDRAWSRWKLWRRIYQKSLGKSLTSEEIGVRIKESVVRGEFKRTLSFMELNGLLDECSYFSKKTEISRWISTGEISPFYVVLSPRIKIMFPEDPPVDPALYRPSITPESEALFRERFSHEF